MAPSSPATRVLRCAAASVDAIAIPIAPSPMAAVQARAEVEPRQVQLSWRRWIAAFRRITTSRSGDSARRAPPRQMQERVTMTTVGRTTIADRAVLVTGANRGIGQALVEEALRRGAKRVYAGTRQRLAHPDRRVTP